MKKSWLSVAIAILVGFIVLLGYFFPGSILGVLRSEIIDLAVILMAVAFLIGVLNLNHIHLKKVGQGGSQALYSFILVMTFLLAFILTILPGKQYGNFVFNYIQMPVETSLMAVVSFGLVFALSRVLQTQKSFYGVVFVFFAVLTLMMAAPLMNIPLLGGFLDTNVWAEAGIRGILLGVALGTIATGVRILLGIDRPYGK